MRNERHQHVIVEPEMLNVLPNKLVIEDVIKPIPWYKKAFPFLPDGMCKEKIEKILTKIKGKESNGTKI